MKPVWKWMLLTLALGTTAAHAQMYKWVGPDGKISYSDTPPPASAVRAERKEVGGSSIGGAALPYELGQATRNNPVTLYTGADCPPCENARKMLTERGIPFSEKIVTNNEEIARLKEIGGAAQLPLLTVGRNKEQGFNASTWGTALSSAGYPATNQLPKAWRNAPAQALIPSARAVAPAAPGTPAAQAAEPAPATSDTSPAIGNAPPGFRF